jgi:hypothetical protein
MQQTIAALKIAMKRNKCVIVIDININVFRCKIRHFYFNKWVRFIKKLDFLLR